VSSGLIGSLILGVLGIAAAQCMVCNRCLRCGSLVTWPSVHMRRMIGAMAKLAQDKAAPPHAR
jgi:hypothetical protein